MAAAAVLLAAGCLGQDPSPALLDAPDGGGLAAFSVVLHVSSDSAAGVRVLDATLDTAAPGVWVDLVTVRPGEYKGAMALAIEQREELWTGRLDLELHDGLGPSNLVLQLGPWLPEEDAIALVSFRLPAAGALEVQSLEGPVEVPGLPTPAYGRVLWPNGIERPLPDFPYTIWVPSEHPRLWAGEPVTYRIDAVDAEWLIDGEAAAEGPRLDLELEPGPHMLDVRVPHDGAWVTTSFALSGAEKWAVRDTILVPSPHALQTLGAVAPWEMTWEVRPGNVYTVLTLNGGPETPAALIDLYVVDPHGGVVGRGEWEEPTERRLEFTQLPPGPYTLQVYSRDTINAQFVLAGITDY
jgi:hypothetical protein